MKFSERKIERRKFFGTAGKGLIAAAVLSALPFKLQSLFVKKEKNVKVKIHPSAIKRNK